MKKISLSLFIMILSLCGCSNKSSAEAKVTIKTPFATYYEMSDGTYKTDSNTYKYKLEISGRMHNAKNDSTFVFLSNIENITFDEAWKSAGFSSNTKDYFSPEEAVLVDCE